MKRLICLISPILACLPAHLNAQTISADKTSMSFVAQAGGSAVTQTLNISSTVAAVPFSVTSNTQWLTVNPQGGTTPSAVTVKADPALLAPAIYNATLTVFSNFGSINIPVTLNASSIGISPQSLQFTYGSGGTVPSAQTITLSGQTTNFSAAASTTSGGSWLQVSPGSGTSPGAVSAIINSAVVSASMSPGTYNGTITITPTSGPVTTPISIPVTLTVTAAPRVTVNPTAVNLNFQIGGVNPQPPQTVTLSASGSVPVNYGFATQVGPNPAGRNWIVTNPTGGSIPQNGSTTATIGYDSTANLPAGTYTGTVTVNAPGGDPDHQDIAVKLLVSNQPLLNLPNATLSFAYQIGGAAPAAKSVTATSTAVAANATTGQMPLTFTINTNGTGNWLSVPTQNPVTGTPFSVAVNPGGLAPGNYSATITVNGIGAGNPPQQIPVTLSVSNDPLVVATVNGCSTLIQSCSMIFPYQPSQLLPAQQTIRVSSSTGAVLNFTAAASANSCGNNWLVLSGTTSGTTEALLSAAINPAGIAAGTQCAGSITINATNPASGVANPNSSVTIPVTLYVSTTPLLAVNPLALNFTGQVSGQAPAAQTLVLNSTSATEPLNYTVTFTASSGGNNWLFVGPLSGTTLAGSNTLTASVLQGLLSPGTYNGSITITATTQTGGTVADSPITIPVTFTVTAGNLTVNPANLAFTYTLGGSSPAAKAVAVGSTGQALPFTATASTQSSGNWLSVAPASGTTPGTVNVSIDGSKFTSAGAFNGSITIVSAGAGNSPLVVPVTVQVSPGTLAVTPDTMTFTQAAGGSAPAAQTLRVTGTPGSLGFTVAVTTDNGGGWLTATPATGTTPGDVSVKADGAGLLPGQYTGTVTVTAAGGAQGSPKSVRVTLNVLNAQGITATPANLSFNYTTGLAVPPAQTVTIATTGGVANFTATATTASGGKWLTVTPASGTTPGTLTVAVAPQDLAPGNYTGTVSIDSPSSVSHPAAAVTVNLTVSAIPKPVVNAIANAASYATVNISPGENIVLFGTGIGPAELVRGRLTAAGAVDTNVGNTRVLFDGVPAPLIYVSATQTSVMVPYGVGGRTAASVVVEYQGVQSNAISYNIAPASPGIYTLNQAGNGPGAILNQDFNVNGSANPAAKGSVVQVYMTGEGATSPAGSDGGIAPVNGSGLNKPVLPVTATIGGVPATVQYYGSAPGIVYGVMQVNVVVPAGAPSGAAVPIEIAVGASRTQANVTVAIQ